MKKVPYHKMMVEMDGQEAEIVIRALQLYVSEEPSNTKKYKITFYNNLILKIKKRKHEFHGEWKQYIFEDFNSHNSALEKDIYPAPF